MTEREQVVAWLKAEACASIRLGEDALDHKTTCAWRDRADGLLSAAYAIERGEHLAQGIETREGGDAKTGPVRQHESPVGVADAPNLSPKDGS